MRTDDETLLFKGSRKADKLRAEAKKLKRNEERREFKREHLTKSHDQKPS